MKNLEFKIQINAPIAKVRDTMLSDKGYRDWTSVFNPVGSWFEWEWSTWSDIRFLGPDPKHPEDIGGMYGTIKENKLHEYIAIEYIGEIQNDQEIPKPARKWALEQYTFSSSENGTSLKIDLQTTEDAADYLQQMWPKALQKLKTLCE